MEVANVVPVSSGVCLAMNVANAVAYKMSGLGFDSRERPTERAFGNSITGIFEGHLELDDNAIFTFEFDSGIVVRVVMMDFVGDWLVQCVQVSYARPATGGEYSHSFDPDELRALRNSPFGWHAPEITYDIPVFRQ